MACDSLEARPLAHDVAVRVIVLKHIVILGYAAMREGRRTAALAQVRDACLDALAPYIASVTIDESLFLHSENDVSEESQWQMALGRVEYVRPLLWALGLIDSLPTYDVVADLGDLLELNELKQTNFLPRATLRPRAEIDRARSVAEAWYWRRRSRELIEAGVKLPADRKLRKRDIYDRNDLERWTARECLADGTLNQVIEEDFPAFGKAYRDLAPEEWGVVGAITGARYYALNWLCGWAPENDWDRVPMGL